MADIGDLPNVTDNAEDVDMAGERMYTKLCSDQGGKEDGGEENDLMTGSSCCERMEISKWGQRGWHN